MDDIEGTSVQTYHTPHLRTYGSISALTQTAQKANTSDNPGQEVNMTGDSALGPPLLGPPETTGW